MPIKNDVGTLGHGLDVRGDGGYSIVPPSVHRSGRRYTWELAHHPEDTPLAPMPDWFVALCRATIPRHGPDAGAPIATGQRNRTLFLLGCSMRRAQATLKALGARALAAEDRPLVKHWCVRMPMGG